MDTIVVENFFDNFENIKNEFKKIPLYGLEEYMERFHKGEKRTVNWPGKRSEALHESKPFLFNLIYKELSTKISFFNENQTQMFSYVHLRLNEDNKNDWIHTDPNYYTLIIYLSETNLNSGTAIYPESGDEPSTVIGFVQNRAVLFRSHQRHKSINNYGNNLEDGRLTLNCFINLR